MSAATIQSLVKRWSAIRDKHGDPYAAVEKWAGAKATEWWPYMVIVDQIESGWTDTFRSALALHLANHYKPVEHALAAFVVLNGPWPSDPTTALNLLTLAHRTSPSSQHPLDRFVSQAALGCLREGLSDSSPLVAEEAINILGGFGEHHFWAATARDISSVRDMLAKVLARLDDDDISGLLRDRAESALADARATAALNESDAQLLMMELESTWTRMPHGAQLETLQDHVIALAWAVAGGKRRAVHVLRIDDSKVKPDRVFSGWSMIDPWIAVVRDLIGPDYKITFAPLSAAEGSLIVVLRVDADGDINDDIAKQLLAAKNAPLTSIAAEDLRNVLSSSGVRIHVAHVEANLASASLSLEPGSGVAFAPVHARRLTTGDIPQANDWDKIFALVECVGSSRPVRPMDINVTTDRQVQYYKAAARVVGLLTPTDELTRTGWLVHVATGDDRWKRACGAFESSPCGQAWIEWSRGKKLSEVPLGSAKEFLEARSALTGDTVGRRANTLEMWLKALRPYA